MELTRAYILGNAVGEAYAKLEKAEKELGIKSKEYKELYEQYIDLYKQYLFLDK